MPLVKVSLQLDENPRLMLCFTVIETIENQVKQCVISPHVLDS